MQYHVLPFYKLDNRVKDIQTEIMLLDENLSVIKAELSRKENVALEDELKKRDIAGLGFEEMLQTIYNDEDLYNKLNHKVEEVESSHPEYLKMTKQKEELVQELRDMIIELYRTNLILLDHNQLMQGQEGLVVYFDLEIVKKGERTGMVEIERMPSDTKQEIVDKFKEAELTLKDVFV